MAQDQTIFRGPFRVAYLGVKTLALYAGCFLLCYYWPLFLNVAIAPPLSLQVEAFAGVLLTPLGFVILGIAQGKRLAIVHGASLVVGAGMALALIPGDADPRQRIALWTALLAVVYVVGFVFGFRRQLQVHREGETSVG